jgi:HK97 family phage major capsid protein/HK97 family phage prohead protease
MNRQIAHSVLTVKNVNEEQRIIRGIATTPTPDRMGDIVEPLGIQFKNPMPLLWQHRHDQPVGKVKFFPPTDDGIEFEAEVLTFDSPPGLKARTDEAWASVKSGLIAGVSIGFRPIEYEPMKSGAYRFTKSEVYELSLVTVPAQPDAVILRDASAMLALVKSFDTEQRASSGNEAPAEDHPTPGASGNKSISLKPKEGKTMKTIAEQIASFEALRNEKATRMEAIMNKSIEEGRSTDEAEQTEFDDLTSEVKTIDADLKRLKSLEALKLSTARPVAAKSIEDGSAHRGSIPAQVKVRTPVEKGIRFARLARVKALSALNYEPALAVAEKLFGQRDPEFVSMVKANVTAHATTDAEQGGFLVGEETGMFADFVEFLRPMTILGKFGQGGIPALRQVPFRVPLIGQTTGGAGYWVGEGKPKPLTSFDGERNTIEPLKVANIAVATMELLRDSSPSAEAWLRDQLAAALQARLDTDFIDPAKAASAGISPASILNGADAVVSTGATADAVRLDVRALFQKFIDANNPPMSGVWIMSNTNALALSLLVNDLGQPEFPGMTMMGGTFQGLPVITSQYIGANVALVNASDIYFADNGEVSVDFSREASLQMLDNPTNDTVTPTATSMVSMFQTNSVAFRAERSLNWARRRATSVAYLSAVTWGGAVPAS